MKKVSALLPAVAVAALLLFSFPFAGAASAAAADDAVITLPPPDKSGGVPLMKALSERRSNRNFSEQALSRQDLSNLLWAAFGVNRQDGRRTAPTANNSQKVAVYAAMGTGVWQYDGAAHTLTKVLSRDTVKEFGGAPLTLVHAAPEGLHGAMHLGSVYQNVGLYCASAGLANVVKATGVDVLKNDLKLPEGYKILIIQSVGKPK
ncbi:MAG: nitroreductase family protein [Desulfovibrio sp.]|nr:nitroreductase family protein [Desulfovibrio sp.]